MTKLESFVNHPSPLILDEGIWVIQDFLSQEILDTLFNIIDTATTEDWDKYISNPNGQWYKNVLMFDHEVQTTISLALSALLSNKYTFLKPSYIRKTNHYKGLDLHYDNQVQHRCEFGIVLYLNDDYEGGEIYYPFRGKEYKPISNSLVIHSADKDYSHAVKPLRGNNRYFLTFWAYKDDDEYGIS